MYTELNILFVSDSNSNSEKLLNFIQQEELPFNIQFANFNNIESLLDDNIILFYYNNAFINSIEQIKQHEFTNKEKIFVLHEDLAKASLSKVDISFCNPQNIISTCNLEKVFYRIYKAYNLLEIVITNKHNKSLTEDLISMINTTREEYRQMGDTIPFGIWKTFPDGTPQYASPSFLDLLGLSLEELPNSNWIKILDIKSKYKFLKKWAYCINTGTPWEHEFSLTDDKGKTYYILSKGRPIKNSSEEITSWVGINLDITNKVELDNMLKVYSDSLNQTLDRIQDSFFAVDKNWNITFLNRTASKYITDPENILGKNIWETFPLIKGTIYDKKYREAMEKEIAVSFEAQDIYTNNWDLVNVYPSNNGITIYIVDITDKKIAEEKLNSALKEKELLIKEVHHRVKNNMQIISSLLALQISFLDDQDAISRINDTISRIKTMSIVHEQLYRQNSLTSIDFKEYLSTLLSNLFTSYKSPDKLIRLNLICDPFIVHIDDAINLGLIVNEIVLNSLKHAFVKKDEGKVSITAHLDDETLSLSVADDGIRVEHIDDQRTAAAFGSQLIEALCKQMDAEVDTNINNGTSYKFIFKLKSVAVS